MQVRVSTREYVDFDGYYSYVKGVTEEGLDAAGQLGEDVARIHAPRRSGWLAASIQASRTAGYMVRLRALAPWAAPQEKGGAAHEIGREGQFLSNPEEDFFAVGPVHHPGNPPHPFLHPAMIEMARFMADWWRRNA